MQGDCGKEAIPKIITFTKHFKLTPANVPAASISPIKPHSHLNQTISGYLINIPKFLNIYCFLCIPGQKMCCSWENDASQ